ncbi:mechanosensitive ion channel family protein [Roseovarius aquimarinus]|uniref:Mechanosensitive ion channel family protein n=1 Tax=Roseovarius aquimarinus TaxID=1229156 RepID=A0ABW7I541_9RHOB
MNFDPADIPTLSRLAEWLAGLPELLQVSLVLALIVAAGLLAHTLFFRFLLTRVGGRFSMTRSLLERARRPLRLGFILAALLIGLPRLDLGGRVQDVVEHAALVLLITLIGWMLIVLTNHFAERSARHYRMDTDDNLRARKFVTQLRVMKRAANIIIGLVTAGAVLLTFEGVQEYGVSLFASAGAAGLILGLAARPVLANLIAGIQIAITQPIRLEDVVIIEGEWGWIEEIFATYVIVRIWDRRRLVVPLSYFIEKPFQNWTRESAQVIGAVTWDLDYTAPVKAMREKLDEFLGQSELWDKEVSNLQVVETGPETITIRALMTARTSPMVWDLRCDVREKMVEWLQREHPEALPRTRGEFRMKDTPDRESARQEDVERGGAGQ